MTRASAVALVPMLAVALSPVLPTRVEGQPAAAREVAQPPSLLPSAGLLPTFSVVYRPGPAWRAGMPMRPRGRASSRGPSGQGVQRTIISAGSLEDARRIVAEDPAVNAGVFVVEVQPFDAR